MKSTSLIAAALAIALGQAAAAQDRDAIGTERHTLAQSAGLRALYACTGHFTAGLSAERLEADIFSNYGTGFVGPRNVTIREAQKRVEVSYAPDMPPRIAVWRPLLGCVQLPIGTAPDAEFPVPRLPAGMQAPDFDAQPWPQGDARATE